MAIESTVSSDFFYPRSSIVKSVCDCGLPGVILKMSVYNHFLFFLSILVRSYCVPISHLFIYYF